MDLTKYNLRCNRSISEKMTKKDFIYDIKPTHFSLYKQFNNKSTINKIFEKSMKHKILYQLPRQTSISSEFRTTDVKKWRTNFQLPVQRNLEFKCNFCREPLATLFSLSTHVKFHVKEFCKKCYWVLEDNETMEQHFEQKRH